MSEIAFHLTVINFDTLCFCEFFFTLEFYWYRIWIPEIFEILFKILFLFFEISYPLSPNEPLFLDCLLLVFNEMFLS